MRVRESAQLLSRTGPVLVRRVRIAGLVAEDVVAAVDRDPADDGPLDRHRSGRCEHDLQPPHGPEAAVREETVVADRDPESGHDVERRREDDVEES